MYYSLGVLYFHVLAILFLCLGCFFMGSYCKFCIKDTDASFCFDFMPLPRMGLVILMVDM